MSDQERKYSFEFTALPHVFTDFWMPLLSPTAIVTMIALYRVTLGWQGVEAAISFPKLAKMTGIASYDTLTQDLEELQTAGLICRKGEQGKHRMSIYQLMQSALTFTDFVKQLHESHASPTFTESVKRPLQKSKKHIYRNRKPSVTESVKPKGQLGSHQTRQEAPSRKSERGAKESVKETFEIKDKYIQPQASPSAAASPNGSPPVSLSKTEKEENENPPAPAFSRGEQAPLQAKEASLSNAPSLGRKEAPAPVRTAEIEAARQRQREAIDARRQAKELERKATLAAERIARAAKETEQRAVGKLQERYDVLVLAKQKTEPGSPAWQQAHEELQEVKHQLAAYGWYL